MGGGGRAGRQGVLNWVACVCLGGSGDEVITDLRGAVKPRNASL
jgi:hypothetical protein